MYVFLDSSLTIFAQQLADSIWIANSTLLYSEDGESQPDLVLVPQVNAHGDTHGLGWDLFYGYAGIATHEARPGIRVIWVLFLQLRWN